MAPDVPIHGVSMEVASHKNESLRNTAYKKYSSSFFQASFEN